MYKRQIIFSSFFVTFPISGAFPMQVLNSMYFQHSHIFSIEVNYSLLEASPITSSSIWGTITFSIMGSSLWPLLISQLHSSSSNSSHIYTSTSEASSSAHLWTPFWPSSLSKSNDWMSLLINCEYGRRTQMRLEDTHYTKAHNGYCNTHVNSNRSWFYVPWIL